MPTDPTPFRSPQRASAGRTDAGVDPERADQPWWARPVDDPAPGVVDPHHLSDEAAVEGGYDVGGWTLPVTSDDPQSGTVAGGPVPRAGAGGAGPDAVGASGAGPDTDEAPRDGSHRTGSPAAGPFEPDQAGTAEHRPELCGVCPICAGFRLLEGLRPELAGHLAEAAYHLAAALRSLAEHPPSPRGEAEGRSGPTTMQHIDVE